MSITDTELATCKIIEVDAIPRVIDITIVVSGAPPATAPSYTHIQATPSVIWTIDHPLSFRPNVTVVDATGQEIWPGDVQYPSATQVLLVFSSAVDGQAYLS